jgi:hypothetical protein
MDDLKQIWQDQEVEEMKLSLEQVRTKAAKFQRRIQWRNWREYAASAFVVVMFGIYFVRSTHTLERIANALIIAGTIYMAWHLHAKGSAKSLPADMGRADCMGFYRSELARQRDLLRGIWRWALGPMIPGLALLCIYRTVSSPPVRPWEVVGSAAPLIVIFWAIGWLNLRAARRLDRRVAELDRELST